MRARTAPSWWRGINSTERAMRAEFPEIQWLFVEPDVTDLKRRVRMESLITT